MPLHPLERKGFTWPCKNKWVAFRIQAQGSKNAPLLCRWSLRLRSRTSISATPPHGVRHPFLVACWTTTGLQESFKRHQGDLNWSHPRSHASRRSQSTVLTLTAKPDIIEDIRKMVAEHSKQNVVSEKSFLSYIGKLNHLAGSVSMSDLCGLLCKTEARAAPRNCFWSKQWLCYTVATRVIEPRGRASSKSVSSASLFWTKATSQHPRGCHAMGPWLLHLPWRRGRPLLCRPVRARRCRIKCGWRLAFAKFTRSVDARTFRQESRACDKCWVQEASDSSDSSSDSD